MGFFSWKTSDTDKSICNSASGRKTFTVYMITEDGQVFTEKDYEGYGEFGGKDIYELIAEMNGMKPKDGEMRLQAIGLLHKKWIENRTGHVKYEFGKDFTNWEQKLKSEGGKTPNELVRQGWKQVYPNGNGDFEKAAKNGIKLPKLVQNLPDKKEWKRIFDLLPYPKCCEFQGFFYEEESDEGDAY